MKYISDFNRLLCMLDDNFNWTIEYDDEEIQDMVDCEIKQNHKLYNKALIPIAKCINNFDVLAYYNENNSDNIVLIHFRGYLSNKDSEPIIKEYQNISEALLDIKKIYTNYYKNNIYDNIIESEYIKTQKTRNTLKGLYSIMPIIYDTLLKMNDFRGCLAKDEEQDLLQIQDLFQFFSFDFVFKIRSIFMLSEIGNYADSAIILRSLIETFFYFKYYIIKNDGTKLSNYVFQNKKNTTRIKDIMEKIAPSYYDTEYNELCKFAHGNPLIIGLLRGNVSKDEPLKYNLYSINIEWYSYILNQTIPLIIGFFNMYNQVYKNNTLSTNTQISNNIELIKNFIEKDMSERYMIYPKHKAMIDLQKMIIYF